MSTPRPPHRTPDARPPISVVVPTWEGSVDWLGDCLDALAAQQGPAPQVIVVIDGPADRVLALIHDRLPGARQLLLRERRGFAVAASAGLRAARGSLVALLNDDANPDPDWLLALQDAAARHPGAGSFASRVLCADDPTLLDSAGHGLTRWGEPFAIGHHAADGPTFRVEQPVFGAPACASLYRWELLRDCGVFDPEYGAYLEDVDLSLRAQLLGFPCVYVPTARVLHRGSASYGWGRHGNGRAERLVARNRVRLLARALPRNALRAAALPAAVSIAADLAWRVGTGRHAGAALAGTLDGLRETRAALAARGAVLGARRVDDATIGRVLKESERRLLHDPAPPSQGRRARVALGRVLARWMDAREAAIAAPVWES